MILFENTEDTCNKVFSIFLSVGDYKLSAKADVTHLPCFTWRSIVVDFLAGAQQYSYKRDKEIFFGQCHEQNSIYNIVMNAVP